MATLAGLLTSLAFGGMAFFTLVMAPLIFGKLGPEQGGRLMRDAFAIYYPLMATLTGIAAISAPPFWMGALLSLVASGFILAHLMLRPEINRLSDLKAAGDVEAVGQFRRLHGLSQVLNFAQFLALFITLFGMVNH